MLTSLPQKSFLQTKYIIAAYILLLAVNISGLFIPLMNNDAGEYALVAMRMVKQNDFVNLIRKGEDYLDKPHLLFWLSAISMKIFGFTAFAYKLPSLLFAFTGIYATTKLGSLLYNRQTGLLAGLVLGFSQAFIFSNHDVRTDAILTGATIFSVYKFIEYSYKRKYTSLIIASLFLALAVGTKGMVAVLVTGVFVLIHLLYHKKIKEIFTVGWLSSIVWFFIFLSPFLYCYYLQFDAHPEKIIKGVKGVSGISFLLWGQSFERLAGKGTMVDNPDFFFFFHTMLWAFLPWSILAYYSIFKDLLITIKNKFKVVPGLQAALSCSVIILLLIFSVSRFKLPHYLNILFPLLSILTANNILAVLAKNKFNWMGIVLYAICCIYTLAVILLNGWAFPLDSFFTILTAAVSLIIVTYSFFTFRNKTIKPVFTVLLIVGFSNLLININFYPKLLTYQGSIGLADYVNKNNISKDNLYSFLANREFSFDYYIQKDVVEKETADLQNMSNSHQPFYIVTDKTRIKELYNAAINFKQIQAERDFHITQLTLPFINPATRSKTLDSLILVRIN